MEVQILYSSLYATSRIHLQQSFHFLCVPLPGACKHEIFHGPDSSWNESVHLLMQLLGCTVVVWCFTYSPLFELNMIYSTSFTRLKWCFILLVRAWMNRASQGVEMRGKFGGCQVLFFFPYRSFLTPFSTAHVLTIQDQPGVICLCFTVTPLRFTDTYFIWICCFVYLGYRLVDVLLTVNRFTSSRVTMRELSTFSYHQLIFELPNWI